MHSLGKGLITLSDLVQVLLIQVYNIYIYSILI